MSSAGQLRNSPAEQGGLLDTNLEEKRFLESL